MVGPVIPPMAGNTVFQASIGGTVQNQLLKLRDAHSEGRDNVFQGYLDSLLTEEQSRIGSHDYRAYHRRRYSYILDLARSWRPERESSVLDVGRSPLSGMLLSHYAKVTTLGFPLEITATQPHDGGVAAGISGQKFATHIVYDLNDAQYGTPIPTSEKFDLILFCETIEHVYTAPELVMFSLSQILAPDGLLICQTPNAASLDKRLQMLFGRNPFERIRVNRENPGHYREYTRGELCEIAAASGLAVLDHEYKEYFGCDGGQLKKAAAQAFRLVSTVVPHWARGQVLICRKSRD